MGIFPGHSPEHSLDIPGHIPLDIPLNIIPRTFPLNIFPDTFPGHIPLDILSGHFPTDIFPRHIPLDIFPGHIALDISYCMVIFPGHILLEIPPRHIPGTYSSGHSPDVFPTLKSERKTGIMSSGVGSNLQVGAKCRHEAPAEFFFDVSPHFSLVPPHEGAQRLFVTD